MPEPFFIIKRRPYEEPYHTQLEIFVSNGFFTGKTDIYCNVEDLSEIGKSLMNIPTRIGDEYLYEYGTEDPQAKFYRHFLIRAYTVDSAGHCAIQFRINLNQTEPNEGICCFSIQTEVSAITRLGELFQTFSTLNHLELHWSPTSGTLYEHYQRPSA